MVPFAPIVIALVAYGIIILYAVVRCLMLLGNRSAANRRSFLHAVIAGLLFLPSTWFVTLVWDTFSWRIMMWPIPRTSEILMVLFVACGLLIAYAAAFALVRLPNICKRTWNYLRQRRFWFSLRELLLATGFLGLALYVVVRLLLPILNERRAVHQIKGAGGDVFFQYSAPNVHDGMRIVQRVFAHNDAQATLIARHWEHLPKTTEVVLDAGVTNVGLKALCQVERPLAVSGLILQGSGITNSGLEFLLGLDKLQSLTIANSAAIDHGGMTYLKDVRGLKRLVLTEHGVAKLAPLISEAILQRVSELDDLTSLELRYEGNKAFYLYDRDVRHLHRMKQLRFMRLKNCRVSDEAVAELRKALPDCELIVVPRVFVERNFFGGGFPGPPEKLTTQQQVELLIGADTPTYIRAQASKSLWETSPEQLHVILPQLLDAVVREQDRFVVSQIVNVIQRAGPEAIPEVKAAITRSESDWSCRELLRALRGLGEPGQQEFNQLMQQNPEYRSFFIGRERSPDQAKP